MNDIRPPRIDRYTSVDGDLGGRNLVDNPRDLCRVKPGRAGNSDYIQRGPVYGGRMHGRSSNTPVQDIEKD